MSDLLKVSLFLTSIHSDRMVMFDGGGMARDCILLAIASCLLLFFDHGGVLIFSTLVYT